MEFQRTQYVNRLLAERGNHMVKVVTGLRRVGKSYLLFNLFRRQLLIQGVSEDHVIMLQLDDFGHRQFRKAETLYNYVRQQVTGEGVYYVIIDEVQMLEDFVDVLNGFLHMPNVEVYVTGSNARLLSRDIATEFRGRGVQIHVFPLSFAEFMEGYHGSVHDGWNEYLLYGGLPLVALTPNVQGKINLLNSLISETYLNDIVARNRVDGDAELRDLLMLLASNIGCLTNQRRLSATFQSEKHVAVRPERVGQYITMLQDSFLLDAALRFDVKGNRYINTPQKYYFTDCGLRNALLGFRQIEPSHLMENILYVELVRRGYSVDVGVLTKYGKDAQGKTTRSELEIDFVCNRGGERLYVQSAFSLPDSQKVQQERRSLDNVGDAFKKLIVTADHVPSHMLDGGIELIQVQDFLLRG